MTSRTAPSLLSPLERPLLFRLAAGLPRAVRPDHLTLLGLAGALLSFFAYLLARTQPGFLWLASLGIAINWFGDSLDGTLARQRGTERPRYGFFLDHSADLFAQLLIGLGLMLCGLLAPMAAAMMLISYLMAVAAAMIGRSVTQEMAQSLGRIGPTEVRLLLIGINAWLFLDPPQPRLSVLGLQLSLLDAALLVLALLAILALALSTAATARRLSRQEPPP